MEGSESIINNFLMEVDCLTHRLRNIKHSFKTAINKRLKTRLINESKAIYERVDQIYKLAELTNNESKDRINFSALLIEKCRRTLNETRVENNLFFL